MSAIDEFRVFLAKLDMPRVMVTGAHPDGLDATYNVCLELVRGEHTGIGHAFAFTERQARSIAEVLVDLCELVARAETRNIRALWASMRHEIGFIGAAGPPVMALSSVDTALWDLQARELGVPLYVLLGARTSRVPSYGSGGGLSYTIEELVEEAQLCLDLGHRAYKMKGGRSAWEEDVERVRGVREHFGPGLRLLIDVNQRWEPDEAVEAGRQLAKYDPFWIEDPVNVADNEGSARVAPALTEVRVATGENVYLREGWDSVIAARACDVLIIDLMRSGGPTEFAHGAATAAGNRIPVACHIFPEISAHLLAATENGSYVEHVPGWWDRLYETQMNVDDGCVTLSDTPGLGLAFSSSVRSSVFYS